jgi:hypothetical protein
MLGYRRVAIAMDGSKLPEVATNTYPGTLLAISTSLYAS